MEAQFLDLLQSENSSLNTWIVMSFARQELFKNILLDTKLVSFLQIKQAEYTDPDC